MGAGGPRRSLSLQRGSPRGFPPRRIPRVPWGSREGPVGLRAVGHTVGVPRQGGQWRSHRCSAGSVVLCTSPVGLWSSRRVAVPPGGFLCIPSRSLCAPRISACPHEVPLRPHTPQGAAARPGAIRPSRQQRAVTRGERSRREGGAERPEAPCHVAAPGSGGRSAAMSSGGGGNGAAAAGTEAGDGFVSSSGSERRVHIMVEYW